MTCGRRCRGDDSGLVSTELTIVVPVLVWWLMLIVQFGLWWHGSGFSRLGVDRLGSGGFLQGRVFTSNARNVRPFPG
jgi:hypothetical protein